jgi:hypothetical protein
LREADREKRFIVKREIRGKGNVQKSWKPKQDDYLGVMKGCEHRVLAFEVLSDFDL